MNKTIQKLENQVINLESTLAHMQRDLESQNDVILENNSKIKQLELAIKRLTIMQTAANAAPEERSLEDEKPPHY